MRKKQIWVVIGICIGLLVVGLKQVNKNNTVLPTPIPNENTYLVEKVVDGDTIQVKIDGKKETVRLIGVDTPETVDPRKPVQCFGHEASQETKRLAEGKQVKLEADATQGDKDKYQRLLRYIFLADGTNLNESLIARGFGHEYTYDMPYKYQAEFKLAEKTAREKGLGLWGAGVCPVIPTQVVLGASTTCGDKTKCTEMVSCDEAKFFLINCGVKTLDSNGNGVPCEVLCK